MKIVRGYWHNRNMLSVLLALASAPLATGAALSVESATQSSMSIRQILDVSAETQRLTVRQLEALEYKFLVIETGSGGESSAGAMAGGMFPLMLFGAMMGGLSEQMGPDAQELMREITDSANLYMTRGQETTIGGDAFLVAYKLPSFEYFLFGGESMEGRLTYIRMSEISALSPRGDLDADRYEELIEQLREMSEGMEGDGMFGFDDFDPDGSFELSDGASVGEREMIGGFRAAEVGRAMESYVTDRDREFPNWTSPDQLIEGLSAYVMDALALQVTNPRGGNWLYNESLAGRQLLSIENPWEVPIIAEQFSWAHDGTRIVVFADFEWRWVWQEEWETMVSQFRSSRIGD